MKNIFAVCAYVLSIIGAVFVLIFRRNDAFAAYHAKQSLGIAVAAIVAFVVWAVGGWVISWIPYIGFIVAVACFALVIAAYITLAICSIVGIKYAWQGKQQPVPIIGEKILRYLG